MSKRYCPILSARCSPSAPETCCFFWLPWLRISEELWHQTGFAKQSGTSIHVATWPSYDDALTIDDEIELVLQVNGKILNKVAARRGLSKPEAEEIALKDDKVKSKINGSAVRKVIVVPDKLVNVVV